MSRYAENTSVSSEKSRAEIERTLVRYGATGFMYGWQENLAMIQFVMQNRHIKFVLPMPDRDKFRLTPTGKSRPPAGVTKEWEQGCRQSWRALALAIKAKLEAVEAEITEFEEEFLAHIILPDGKRVGDYLVPQLKAAYDSGEMPKMLPDYTA